MYGLVGLFVSVMLGPGADVVEHSACISSAGAEHMACKKTRVPEQASGSAIGGLYWAYHFVNEVDGSTQKCRFTPSCSVFTIQAIDAFGFLRGMLYGLARMQMEHTARSSHAPTRIGDDGTFVHPDPVESWAR